MSPAVGTSHVGRPSVRPRDRQVGQDADDRRRYARMRVRGRFVAGLVLVIAAVAAVFAVTAWSRRSDEGHLRTAVAMAHELRTPTDAVPSKDCHGDGLV